MFNCERCKITSKPHVQPTKVVLETRNKSYTEWNPELREHIEVGFGYEIVKEENWCSECVDKKAAAFLKG